MKNLEARLNGCAEHLQTASPSTPLFFSSPEDASRLSPSGIVPRDMVIVNDRSISMRSQDYPPSRLAGGVTASITCINTRSRLCRQDRVALIAFNDAAEILMPLTAITERARLVRVLGKLSARGGTDIASGLKAAIGLFRQTPAQGRQRHVIVLTDGHGGKPVAKANHLKQQYNAVIDVVGIGGAPADVNEALLRRVATTEPNGFNHYRFIKDSPTLEKHYQRLATGLIWRGKDK
jgi:Ca-activated chloride channel family protein